MENLAEQVQRTARAARLEVDQLLRSPLDRGQVQELRVGNMDQRHVDMIYPLSIDTYPSAIRAALSSTKRTWLNRELAKLDPTAYCLYLPADAYRTLRRQLPPLPSSRPDAEGELAYTAAFVNHLADEDLTPYVEALSKSQPEDLRRWQNLLSQIQQIERVLRDTQAQVSPLGRAAHRLRKAAR